MPQANNGEKTRRKLELLRRREEERSVELLAQRMGLPYADISTFPIELDALKSVSEETARSAELAVFQATGNNLRIGIRNPEKEETKKALAILRKKNCVCELFLVSKSGLERAWEYYKKVPEEHAALEGAIQISEEKLRQFEKEIKSWEEIKSGVERTLAGKTTEALELILAGALSTDASDIHMEPQEDKAARLRLRLDGVLHDLLFLPQRSYSLLLSRIKLVSELKLNIHDRAQDGRFTIKTALGDVEVRTSVLPGPYGENVVLRVLNPKVLEINFEELGFQPTVIPAIAAELKKPNGMILTTGPTGSGKTTTLYAFLKKIHAPEVKIITIEDPIEYHLSGIEQTQVDPEKGYDFANGLRAIVRQDPDVILVGEIRDGETAETAVNAALTGHLVFSTLHTNNAAGAIPRLTTLGVKPASIAPALNIAMAQRLVRKLCGSCKKPAKLSAVEKKRVGDELARFPKGYPLPQPQKWIVFKSASGSCPACNGTGYKGRTGVFEIIFINERVEQMILHDPTEYEIQKEAAGQGQITMRQDGLLKILAGITDLEEVERVVGA